AASYEVKEGQARLVSVVEEKVGAQPVVKAFGLEGGAIARFREEQARLFGSMVRFGLLSGLVERAPNVVVLLLNLVILAIGAFLVFEARMTVGTLVSFSVLFQSLSNWVQELTFTVPYLLHAAGGMQRLQELLDEAPAVQDVAGAGTFPRLERDLVFDRVAFSYDGGRRILDDVSFTIPKGTWAAFVGPSGSGKSTVLSLVLRFYDPTEGSVRIDGKDLRSGTQSSLRDKIGVVLQDSLLFNATIRRRAPSASRGGALAPRTSPCLSVWGTPEDSGFPGPPSIPSCSSETRSGTSTARTTTRASSPARSRCCGRAARSRSTSPTGIGSGRGSSRARGSGSTRGRSCAGSARSRPTAAAS